MLLQKELERLNRLVTQLENQLNALDYSSKAVELKEKSLNKRLDKALEDMEDIQSQLADLDAQMEKIAAAEETKKQVYGILQSFDVLFDIMDNADRKLLIKELIESIELYPRKNLSGQWIKTIHFKFPMYYNDNNEASCAVCFDMDGNFLPKENTHETVVMLSLKKPDSVINVKVEFGEGEGKVPLDNIAKRAAAYKPKERVTCKMIKEYIEAKYGFKVHTAYIAEVKRDLGLPMNDAPNAVEELKQKKKHPMAEKVEAIRDALIYFKVI